VPSDRYIFLTMNLLRWRSKLEERDFQRLALPIRRMPQKQGFLLTAWVFLPNHGHAIIYPPQPLTISRAMKESRRPQEQVCATLAATAASNVKFWAARFPTCATGNAGSSLSTISRS